MKLKSPFEYQNKIIEIFKENKLYELGVKDCFKKGDVTCILVNIYLIIKFIIVI